MPDPIDFYFDFSSPYGYLASRRIDALAAKHGRTVNWRPHLIGAAFKATGSQPLLNIPMKGDYARIDIPRAARMHGVPFVMPERFPFLSVAAARAFSGSVTVTRRRPWIWRRRSTMRLSGRGATSRTRER